jgi:hypothetical protein
LCQEKSGNPGFNVLISLKDIRVVFGGTDQILVTPDTLGPVVATNTIRILTGFYKKTFQQIFWAILITFSAKFKVILITFQQFFGDFVHFFGKI